MKLIIFTVFTLICVSTFSQNWPGGDILNPRDTIFFSHSSEQIHIGETEENLWEIATPSKDYLDSAFSAPFAIITDSINDYPISNNSFFDFIPLQDEEFEFELQLFIGFSHKFDTDTLKDGGFLTISFDNGETFQNVIDFPEGQFYDGYPGDGTDELNIYTETDTLFNGERGFSGRSDGWVSTMLGWTVWPIQPNRGGSTDTIRLRFNFISDTLENNREGWMIDDIYLFNIDVGSSTTNQNQIQFKLFPNPASKRIMVETEKDYQDLKLEVRSITAKEITHFANGAGNRLEADGIDLETGVYLVTVYGDGEFLGTARCVMHR
ncbi:MAG: hypothetical protein ACJAZC_002667 [Cryomorphaceae bacterium]|jgi:hypothetical protein